MNSQLSFADVQYPLCSQGCVLSWRGYAIWNGTQIVTDNTRQGVNPYEAQLRASTIASSTFKYQGNAQLDGQIYAQPLYMSGLHTDFVRSGAAVFAATEQGTLYALEASNLATIASHSILPSGDTSVPVALLPGGCSNITGEVAITGTPVIDPAPPSTSGNPIMFAVTKSETTGATFHHTIHAWDFEGNATTDVSFDLSSALGWSSTTSLVEHQRASLALSHDANGNAIIFVAWGSHCDTSMTGTSYYGTVAAIKYAYSTSTFSLLNSFVDEGSGGFSQGGIWMAGAAPAIDDATGNLYLVTGNGNFNVTSGHNYGESVLQLNQSLSVIGSYTPNKWKTFNTGGIIAIPAPNTGTVTIANDQDLGSGGSILAHPAGQTINSSNFEVMTVGKVGIEYVLDPTGMSAGLSANDTADPCGTQAKQCFSAITLPAPVNGTIPDGGGGRSAPVFWGGDAGKGLTENFLYTGGSSDTALRYWHMPSSPGNGTFDSTGTWATGQPPSHIIGGNSFPYPGAGTLLTWDDTGLNPVTANAIIWTLDTSGFGVNSSTPSPAILSAYPAELAQGKANQVALISDSTNGPWANKFTVPVVINGQVYAAGQSTSNNGICLSGSTTCKGMLVRWSQ